ncbi:MAG: hypothetical protein R8K50_02365 [Mariprofundus sp.]
MMRPSAFAILTFIFILFTLGACSNSEQVDVMYECPSPSGQIIATVYRVSNGEATRDKTMKINFRPQSADFDHSRDSFSFRHGFDLILRWHSDSEIAVEYPADSEILHQEPVIFGTTQTFSDSERIRVLYQENPSTHGYFMVEQRCFK